MKKPRKPDQPAAAPQAVEKKLADAVETPEPTTHRGTIPIWLIAVVIVLFYCADMYVVTHGADLGGEAGAFPTTVYDPFLNQKQVVAANPVDPARAQFLQGRLVFANAGCVACHGAGGAGVPGQFPPLAGSEWVNTPSPARAIRIVLGGLTGPISVKGENFNNAMPPLGPTLNDEQVAAVLTYVRNEWGNKAGPVTPQQVAKERQATGGRSEMFTAPEIQQVPEAEQ